MADNNRNPMQASDVLQEIEREFPQYTLEERKKRWEAFYNALSPANKLKLEEIIQRGNPNE